TSLRPRGAGAAASRTHFRPAMHSQERVRERWCRGAACCARRRAERSHLPPYPPYPPNLDIRSQITHEYPRTAATLATGSPGLIQTLAEKTAETAKNVTSDPAAAERTGAKNGKNGRNSEPSGNTDARASPDGLTVRPMIQCRKMD